MNGLKKPSAKLDMSSFDLPVNSTTIPPDKYDRIALLLSITQGERSWVELAGAVGATQQHVDLIRECREDCKGKVFLEAWERSGRSSVRKLCFALLKTGIGKCLDELITGCCISEHQFNTLKAEFDSLIETPHAWRKMFPRMDLLDLPIMSPRSEGRGSHEPRERSCDLHEREEEFIEVERHQQACCEDDPTPVSPLTVDPNSVFISYCPESGFQQRRAQRSKISDLVKKLQKYGYTVHYDRFCETAIQEKGGLDLWKEICIRTCKHIIVVCSSKYSDEDRKILFSDRERASVSKIEVDCRILRQIGFSADRPRLISVFFAQNGRDLNVATPTWLAGRKFLLPTDNKKLLHCLAGVPLYQFPKPAKVKVLRPKTIGKCTDPRVLNWDCNA